MKQDITPKITLVGAGPGDLELITVKGLNAIKKADVILYDALVNEELLDYAPIAEKIFVGKRRGFKAYEQEEINQLLVESAQKYGHAVRLKGGDSFVFGRGMEEIEFAEKAGIETSVVPGISSSIAVPALAGIPVTHRGQSNGFFVVSATLASGQLNPELKHAVNTSATVVILMGLSKIEEISALFALNGKWDTPAAIVLNGSLDNEEVLVGQVGELSNLYAGTSNKGPGVIVIGDVVKHAPKTRIVQQLTNEALIA